MNHAAVMSTLNVVKASREKLTHKRWLKLKAVNSFISLCSRPWGSALIEKKIGANLEGCNSLIDVAAGTDELIFRLTCLLPKDALVVANDLDAEAVKYLKRIAPSSKVKLMNADVRDLPAQGRFDCAIAKCLLHHANSDDVLVDFLASLEKIARRVLVIDIEDPFRSSWRAFLWHVVWYRMVLEDDAGRFFTFNEFESLIRAAYPSTSLSFERISAFKGASLFARVDF